MIYYFRTSNPDIFENTDDWLEDPVANIFKLDDMFIGIGDDPFETHIVKILAPSFNVSIDKKGYIASKFKVINISPINEEVIQNYISLGAIPTLDLIEYCIDQLFIDTLLYISKQTPEFLYRYVNKIITERKYTDVLKEVIKSGYDIHRDNDTMFLFAAASKNYELCEFLLEYGANIPRQVVNMYSINTEADLVDKFKNLIDKYKDRILE